MAWAPGLQTLFKGSAEQGSSCREASPQELIRPGRQRVLGSRPTWDSPGQEEAQPGRGVCVDRGDCSWGAGRAGPQATPWMLSLFWEPLKGDQPGQVWSLQRWLMAGSGGPEGVGDG